MDNSIDTLVERVRGYISTGLSPNERADCTAALTELAERLEAAERHDEAATQDAVLFRGRMVDAEARVAELEEALRESLAYDFHATEYLFGHTNGRLRVIPALDVEKIIQSQEIARAALAKGEK